MAVPGLIELNREKKAISKTYTDFFFSKYCYREVLFSQCDIESIYLYFFGTVGIHTRSRRILSKSLKIGGIATVSTASTFRDFVVSFTRNI